MSMHYIEVDFRGALELLIFAAPKPGIEFCGQMSLWQLASVEDGPRNLPLKFRQNRISNKWDIPNMDKCRQDKYFMD